jgi:beta-glucosidase
MNKATKTIKIAIFALFSLLGNIGTPMYAVSAKTVVATAAAGAVAVKQAYNYATFVSLSKWSWRKLIGTDDGRKADSNFFSSDAFKKEFPNGAFPADFLFGAGDSDLQSGGNNTNSTYNHPLFASKYPEMQGVANNGWHPKTFEKVIELIKSLHQNAHRNNIEWSRIQPIADTFDMDVLNEYARRYAELIKNGITPFIGFHHYSDPQWFMWPDGDTNNPIGFEIIENAQYYVDFCVQAFTVINQACQKALDELNLTPQARALLTPRWLTFNSPGSYAINGYLQGERPPAIENQTDRALNVLENMLKAHDKVYFAIKKIDPHALVGITHNIYQADAYYPADAMLPKRLLLYALNFLGTKFANTLSNSAVCHYFTDKQLTAYVPTKGSKNASRYLTARWNRLFFDKKDKTLDFICINYYSHGYMNGFKKPEPATDELKTSNPRYTIYAEGLYRAIKEVYERVAQPLDIPIYITENGFSQNNIVDYAGNPVDGEEQRKIFLNRHFYAIARAIKDGYPVKGYMYWSLFDNCEWADGYKKNYGLATRNLTIKPSGHYYAWIISQLKSLTA